MKKLLLTGLLFSSLSIQATDLNVLQILQFSSYNDLSDASIPGSETVTPNFQPVYMVGYYFNDARLQNIGNDQWMFRGLFKAKGIFLTKKYAPDLRYLYVENKKPAFNHWYVSAGRMNPMNLLPIQRLDGGSVSYTPDPDKGWLFGLIGGAVPVETSGYRGYFYAPYRAGAYTEYTNKNSDHFKVQYNLGSDLKKSVFHQGQLEATKKYSLFTLDSFVRAGAMFTFPYKTLDYALAENSIYTSSKTIHTIGYMKSETLFLWQSSYIREDYQQAFYRFGYTSTDDAWLLNLRGGYTYSLQKPGYIAQAQLIRRKLFPNHSGLIGFDLIAQQKGVYNQLSPKINFGVYPLWVLNLNVYAGYEYMNYRAVTNHGLLYGLSVQGELIGNFSYELNLDFRTIFNANSDLNGSFNLVHLFGTHIGKKESENMPESTIPLSDEENMNSGEEVENNSKEKPVKEIPKDKKDGALKEDKGL
ncbi:MAG: hypothetical protein OEV78_04405 [Spirochaetia bacterium]|nr:hypothetical protein [Spirochaetia bacterium]